MSAALPMDTRMRLDRISELTGDPVSTLRDAIDRGQLRAWKRGKAWYTSLAEHAYWVSQGEWGGLDQPQGRRVESVPKAGRKADLGASRAPEDGRAARAEAKADRPQKVL